VTPRWKQREQIRARSGRRWSAYDASARGDRGSGDGCITGHPTLFGLTPPAFELGRMPEGGGYPEGFVERAAAMMGVEDLGEIVHLCSGSIRARYTFDLRATSAAAVVADVRELPIRSRSARWVMVDPPYDQTYAEALWGLGKQYPTPTVLLREVERILRPGGRVAFLHHVVPTLPPGLDRVGTWGVTTGTGYRIRALTIAEATRHAPPLFLDSDAATATPAAGGVT